MSKEDREYLEEQIRLGEEKEKKLKRQRRIEKMKKEKSSFIADFKAFITKGNVLDMAVGVVVGGAFGKITSGLVNYIINPVIALLTGGVSLDGLRTPLGDPAVDEAGANVVDEFGKLVYENYIEWGMWIQTIIDFLIIAFSIFVVVRVIRNTERTLNAKKLAEEEAAAAAKAAADAEAAAAQAALEEAAAAKKAATEAEFYENVKKQTELLEAISAKINK